MKNQQIYQNKSVLFAMVCLSALFLATSNCNSQKPKPVSKQRQTATVIDHQSYNEKNYYPMAQILLDTDGDKKTPEAVCEIALDDLKPLTHEDLKQMIPTGTTRTIWEWKRIGRFSKFNQ